MIESEAIVSRDSNLVGYFDISDEINQIVQTNQEQEETDSTDNNLLERFTLDQLPMEILAYVVNYLSVKEVKNVVQACKNLNSALLSDHPCFQSSTFTRSYLSCWQLFCYKFQLNYYDYIITKNLFQSHAQELNLFIENKIAQRPSLIKSLFPPQQFVSKMLTMPSDLAEDCVEILSGPLNIIRQKIMLDSELLRKTCPNDLKSLRIFVGHPFPQQAIAEYVRGSYISAPSSVQQLIENCIDIHIMFIMGEGSGSPNSGARTCAFMLELNAFDDDQRIRRLEILMKRDKQKYEKPLALPQQHSHTKTLCSNCKCKSTQPPLAQHQKNYGSSLHLLQGDDLFSADF